MKFEYECWKCPEWHRESAAGVWACLKYGYARPALVIGTRRLAIPRRAWQARTRITPYAIRSSYNLWLYNRQKGNQ